MEELGPVVSLEERRHYRLGALHVLRVELPPNKSLERTRER
jgi:hypothetical protein